MCDPVNPENDRMMSPSSRWDAQAWRAYGVVAAVAVVLFGAWVVGPDANKWVAVQNRPPRDVPALGAEALADPATYVSIEQALADRVRWKFPAMSFLNGASLVTLGLPLSDRMTTGNPLPTVFRSAGVHTMLFYGHEFTMPCHRNTDAMRLGLSNLDKELTAAGKPGVFIVSPNKSTVLLDSTSVWVRGLMACSTAGRGDLLTLADEFDFLQIISPEEVRAVAPEGAYWPGDTHWASTSADTLVLASQRALAGVVLPPAPDGALHPISKPQDMLYMVGIDRKLTALSAHVTPDTVNLSEVKLDSGFTMWKFANPNAPVDAPTALVVTDSFIYGTDIAPKFLSQFKSGYMVPWNSLDELPKLDSTEVIVFQAVERQAYSFFQRLSEREILDYIARPMR